MSNNNHKSKCKGQTGYGVNARWFNIRVARGRRRNRLAYKSLRKNRKRS